MKDHPHLELSRRERQIMDILWQKGKAGVQDVLDALPNPPSYSAVRAMLRLLEEKGTIRHEQDGRRYVFQPVQSSTKARSSALRNLMSTFFDNSAEQAMASLLELQADELTEEDFKRLDRVIDAARKKKGTR